MAKLKPAIKLVKPRIVVSSTMALQWNRTGPARKVPTITTKK